MRLWRKGPRSAQPAPLPGRPVLKKPKSVPVPVAAEKAEELTLQALSQKNLMLAAEAERQLGIAIETLKKVAAGVKNPATLAKQALAQLGAPLFEEQRRDFGPGSPSGHMPSE